MKTRLLVLAFICLFAGGCQWPIQYMGATEYGVRFRMLPPMLGGGLGSHVISPGEMAVVWPWDKIYRIDTAVKYLSWGPSAGTDKDHADYVYTRALDGNEVALAVTIQYQISNKSDELTRLVRYVASSNQRVEDLVHAVARADIRTFMNELKTRAFFNRDSRYGAIDKATLEMNKRLKPWGIEIQEVILDEHRFERLLADGKIDASYQEKIDDTQKLGQETERELLRIETVRAEKNQALNNKQAEVNRVVAEAEGFRNQAHFRGDGYYEARQNDAKAILAAGTAEADGLKEQINALAGVGGEALLKLEFAKQLMKGQPRFVVMGSSSEGSGEIDVRRVDTNELMRQAGVFEALKERDPAQGKETAIENAPDTGKSVVIGE